MARPVNPNKTKEVKLQVPLPVYRQLEEIAAQGFKGTTVPSVAMSLIGDRIEALLKDKILERPKRQD